jgi:hypothetical protein
MENNTRAMDLVDRVANVKIKGESGYSRIRFEDLKVEEDGTAYFICSVKGSKAPSKNSADHQRHIGVKDFAEVRFMDTKEQQRLRSLNKWHDLVSFDDLPEDKKSIFMDIMGETIKKREDLIQSGVTEYSF